QRAALRRSSIGFIYQYHHLLPEFSAFENIVLPQLIFGTPRKKAEKRASDLLKLMGLAERATHRPARLSGGEQQRVAIARAIANKPSLLLADEPTGNLDPEKSAQIFSELLTMVRKEKVGALIATHNLDLAKKMDRIISLKEGVLV
ncbi:MAG: ATP-binding cassette domain-containing protein, partial [Alphaproteobacteria bacterium]|nr:ATP-binding cassette domain-containing protein [Alphaproteobacteria bacterium]